MYQFYNYLVALWFILKSRAVIGLLCSQEMGGSAVDLAKSDCLFVCIYVF